MKINPSMTTTLLAGIVLMGVPGLVFLTGVSGPTAATLIAGCAALCGAGAFASYLWVWAFRAPEEFDASRLFPGLARIEVGIIGSTGAMAILSVLALLLRRAA